MISRILAPLLAPLLTGAALIATPLVAQNQDLGEAPPEGGVIETVDEGEGLNVSVSYEGRLDDLGIVPTATEVVLPGYLWRFRPSGQYAAIKDSAKNLKV